MGCKEDLYVSGGLSRFPESGGIFFHDSGKLSVIIAVVHVGDGKSVILTVGDRKYYV